MEEPQTDPTPDPELAAASSRSSDSLPRPGTSLLPPCSHCGLPSREERYPEDAQNRITELESQVRILTTKATGAADKLADYEDELRRLKSSQLNTSPPASIKDKESEPLPPTPSSGEDATLHKRPSTTSRFSSFLSTKRSNASISPQPPAPPAPSTAARQDDLSAELTSERSMRKEAENKVTQMNTEIEDLSSSLFQQANEMVATERQARAKLEEKAELFEKRCGMLEDRVKTLEKRDADKKRRLDVLEEHVKRNERVRKLLAQGTR